MSPLTLVPDDDAEIVVHSDLLGDLTVRSNELLHFPSGMLGFPDCRRFALLRGGRDGLFWLQSMEYSALVFLLVDPFAIEKNYSFDVQPVQIAELGPGESSDIGLLSVVTLPASSGGLPTVNLQGPLVINFKTRYAKQVVSGDDQHSVRQPLDLASLVA
jgi:flagellar assembly factor FliW